MTDRVNALTVILESDVRVDDIESLENAIRHFRGVLKVKRHISDCTTVVAEERARLELRKKLWAVLYPKDGEP